MATIADLLGIGGSITFGGKTYQLRKPSVTEEARFSRRCEDRAMDAVARAKVPDDQAAELRRAVMRDIGAGHWEVDSAGYVEALRTPDGMGFMLHLILSRDHPEVTEEVGRRLTEHGMKEVAARLIREATDDPKAVAAVLAILGLPPDFLTPAPASSTGSSSSVSATPHSEAPKT